MVSSLLIYYSYLNYNHDLNQKYFSLTKKLHIETDTLIEQKKEATLLLALSLSKDISVQEALENNNYNNLSLKDITDTYKTHTTFKNVWIHLVTKDGISFLKSWTDKKGENILGIRKDIVSFLKKPQIKTLISVGKYDMTIKAMVPIYKNNKLLGIFEVITKINSIAQELAQENILPIVLVDKKYKKQLSHAFTGLFIKHNYVANLQVDPTILEVTKKLNLEETLNNTTPFQILNNKFLTIYHLKDLHGEDMAYFLLYKYLKYIHIDDIKSKHINFLLLWMGISSILMFLFFYVLNKNYTNNLQKEIENKTKELKEINDNLQLLIEQETVKNRQNEIKLFQQENLLRIAQMFKNIAHHWRQPLSAITTSLSGITFKMQYQQITEKEIIKSIDTAICKANELSENIDFFSKSYSNNDDIEKLSLQLLLDNAIKILEPTLIEANIKVFKEYTKVPLEINYNKSNFINMIVTILQNSYDSLLQIKDDNKMIKISLSNTTNFIILEIEDNGIGCCNTIINQVFEPYTTTKHQSSGVGLSLYYAHNIVVNELHGSIEAFNLVNGIKIVIKLPV